MPTTDPDDDRPRWGRHVARPPASPHRPTGGHPRPLTLLPANLTALDADHRQQAVVAMAVLLAEDDEPEPDDDGGEAE
jgi:hypothetical protein